MLSVDRFYDLFGSDDDQHSDDIPSDQCSRFFLCIRISSKEESDDARYQDDKHRSEDEIDSEFDEWVEDFVIESARYLKSFDLSAGRIEQIKDILSDEFGAHDDDDSDDSENDISGSFFSRRIFTRKHDLVESEDRRKDSKDDDQRHQYIHDLVEQEVLYSLRSCGSFCSFKILVYGFYALAQCEIEPI